MARFFHHNFSVSWRKWSQWFLAISWLLGILGGISVFSFSGVINVSLMRMAVFSPVSIVSLVFVLILPFLISAFAVCFFKPWVLLAVSFAKAFVFAFLSLTLVFAFGSGGWLVRLLFLFSELLSLPLLYWFWMHHISGEIRPAPAVIVLYAALVLLIGSIDFCYISPFLAEIIEFWKG